MHSAPGMISCLLSAILKDRRALSAHSIQFLPHLSLSPFLPWKNIERRGRLTCAYLTNKRRPRIYKINDFVALINGELKLERRTFPDVTTGITKLANCYLSQYWISKTYIRKRLPCIIHHNVISAQVARYLLFDCQGIHTDTVK